MAEMASKESQEKANESTTRGTPDTATWEVMLIPPNREYEIVIPQRDIGGKITIIGTVSIGYLRYSNPKPDERDIYKLCAIVDGKRKGTKEPIRRYMPITDLNEGMTFDCGPIANMFNKIKDKRGPDSSR